MSTYIPHHQSCINGVCIATHHNHAAHVLYSVRSRPGSSTILSGFRFKTPVEAVSARRRRLAYREPSMEVGGVSTYLIING